MRISFSIYWIVSISELMLKRHFCELEVLLKMVRKHISLSRSRSNRRGKGDGDEVNSFSSHSLFRQLDIIFLGDYGINSVVVSYYRKSLSVTTNRLPVLSMI